MAVVVVQGVEFGLYGLLREKNRALFKVLFKNTAAAFTLFKYALVITSGARNVPFYVVNLVDFFIGALFGFR